VLGRLGLVIKGAFEEEEFELSQKSQESEAHLSGHA